MRKVLIVERTFTEGIKSNKTKFSRDGKKVVRGTAGQEVAIHKFIIWNFLSHC